ncbi:MAG TPA: TlpA disulfide reductase family protein [Candidatus Methanoperedens sp.]|nr:TlpA disulfide reductase family protein [Candidatus Methanoperedens sp.]
MFKGNGHGYRMAGTALLLSMFLAAPAPLAAEGMGDQKFKPGDTAPEFVASDLAGKEHKLSAYAGKNVVLLNFWGIRCGACLEEMPYLDAIAKKYAAQGLVTLGVDTDGVDAKTIVDTLKEVGVSVDYPLLTDEPFAITDVYTNFLVPLTIVIDRKGIIQYIHTGFEKGTEKHYEDAVKKALGS